MLRAAGSRPPTQDAGAKCVITDTFDDIVEVSVITSGLGEGGGRARGRGGAGRAGTG